ncbi:enoyl-(Acyl carrier protein) reductase domain-containing protein [Trichoderma breve]|uniref:Enoyl-(Acyl carrier protein) reductase domain-containing protein n=1 Tax=Trichoderma breve TaxID=2034170 RepID=A0A9W9EFI9_9HYPO|nr:enoyl-(Acyl carrier protein) reductase domain-containing protein [Trichoderma breve]KAJ4865701.1 enoyl-(Acyl carrier protein) reductase domain-containing protein [Trichoderma breve]
MSFASRVFAITGGASGMGLAVAKLLSKQGAAAVCVGDLNKKNFESATKEIRGENPDTAIDMSALDVSKSAAVEEWISSIVHKYGRLDGAANVAGVPQVARQSSEAGPTLLDESDDMWRLHMGVNLDGVFYCTRSQVRAMTALRHKGDSTERSIVNVSSMAALRNGASCLSYGVAKTAVVSLGARIAKDVAPFGIRVNTVLPGATNSPMLSQFFPRDAKSIVATLGYDVLEPEDIARTIVYLLSDESKKISGVALPVGSGH